MRITTWNFVAALALVGAVGPLAGCGGGGAGANPGGGSPTSRLRLLNAVTDSGTLSATFGRDRIGNNVALGTASTYDSVDARAQILQVLRADGSALQPPAEFRPVAGLSYTVIALGRLGASEVRVIPDSLERPGGELSRIRFIHADTSRSSVRFNIDLDYPGPLPDIQISDVPAGEASAYVEAPAGTVDLIVRNAADGTVITTLRGVPLQRRTLVTYVALAGSGGAQQVARITD